MTNSEARSAIGHWVFDIETRSLPALAHSCPRRFTFYVARPTRSIQRSTFSSNGQNEAPDVDCAVSFIFTMIGSMLVLDALWWWVLARQSDNGVARIVLGVFMGAQMIGLICLVGSRLLHTAWDRLVPKWAASALFIWHFLGLGLLALVGLGLIPTLLAAKLARTGRDRSRIVAPQHLEAWSRRDFLGFIVAAAPPLLTLSLTGVAMRQLDSFRVRRFTVTLAGLAPALDGLTIVQVSDMHVGRFTRGAILDKMVATVNSLDADLVLLTGDLINDALVDLTHGLELARQMQSHFGLFLIEGNHDLIENACEFERRVKASGIPFLLDESAIVHVRGTPVQLLGLSWTRVRGADHDRAIATAVRRLLEQRRNDAFPILLAHHPHSFDAAAEAGVPLTLSGHTHGGQLMLNEQLGFGPAMFRYWSGLYERGNSKLVVSNGVGNWFPLRINSPAEIVHITLRAG
jgi:predicted MPP superfamily phosphohydrolase